MGHLQSVHRSFSFGQLRLLKNINFQTFNEQTNTFGIATAAEVKDRSKERNNNSQNVDSPKPRSSFGCFDKGSKDVAILFLAESPCLNLISD